MRIECPFCHEVRDARLLRLSAQSATFACGGCRSEVKATLEEESAPKNEFVDVGASGGASCPKCDSPVREESTSCPSCGLTKEKFSGYSDAEPSAAPELASAWGRVESAWNQDSAHEDLVAEVSLCGNYRLGALWYRQASSDPARKQKAEEMLDRIQSMATAALMSIKPKVEEEKQPYKNVVILLMVMLFLAAGAGIVLMNKGDEQPAPPLEPSFQAPERR